MVMHWLPKKIQDGMRDAFVAMPIYIQAILCVIGAFIAYQAVSSGLQPFIYFMF